MLYRVDLNSHWVKATGLADLPWVSAHILSKTGVLWCYDLPSVGRDRVPLCWYFGNACYNRFL